jgi:hypothetical protein
MSTKSRDLQIIGWAGSLLGAALYLYGYTLATAATIVPWPSSFSDYIPNWYAEVGLLISCLALVPLYWRVTPRISP